MAEWRVDYSATGDDGLHPCGECGEIDAHQRWCTATERAVLQVVADDG